jgi:hypothetical protein
MMLKVTQSDKILIPIIINMRIFNLFMVELCTGPVIVGRGKVETENRILSRDRDFLKIFFKNPNGPPHYDFFFKKWRKFGIRTNITTLLRTKKFFDFFNGGTIAIVLLFLHKQTILCSKFAYLCFDDKIVIFLTLSITIKHYMNFSPTSYKFGHSISIKSHPLEIH